jgi:DNA-binding response OmpR family regulator
VHILIATDAQWVLDEVQAALDSPSTTFEVVTNGRNVAKAVAERTPDIAILDLQVGSMGGMAITMDLRLDESSNSLPHVPILMLLDRRADVHMARRSGADGWLIKPLDALRLRKAVRDIAAGGCYAEGLPVVDDVVDEVITDTPDESSENSDSQTADSLAP